MPTWAEYKHIAKDRGAQAFEVYVAQTIRTDLAGEVGAAQKAHLTYMQKLEADGHLMFAGPLSDATGLEMSGNGMFVLRAASLEDAKALLDGDPMHQTGFRRYTVCKWLINEGALNVTVGLSSGRVALR